MTEKVIALHNSGEDYGVYTHLSSHFHCLRSGMTWGEAKALAERLNQIIESWPAKRLPALETGKTETVSSPSPPMVALLSKVWASVRPHVHPPYRAWCLSNLLAWFAEEGCDVEKMSDCKGHWSEVKEALKLHGEEVEGA